MKRRIWLAGAGIVTTRGTPPPPEPTADADYDNDEYRSDAAELAVVSVQGFLGFPTPALMTKKGGLAHTWGWVVCGAGQYLVETLFHSATAVLWRHFAGHFHGCSHPPAIIAHARAHTYPHPLSKSPKSIRPLRLLYCTVLYCTYCSTWKWEELRWCEQRLKIMPRAAFWAPLGEQEQHSSVHKGGISKSLSDVAAAKLVPN